MAMFNGTPRRRFELLRGRVLTRFPDLEKKYVEASELNFKRTRELYSLGQVTTTQFREAQLNLIRSRSNVATAKYEAKIKEIDLLRLTGQLILTQS